MMNFLVSHTCKIKCFDVINRSTTHLKKIQNMADLHKYVMDPHFPTEFTGFSYMIK